jgi:DNA-binding transcriptional regulator YdaS (Cro superfamily)
MNPDAIRLKAAIKVWQAQRRAQGLPSLLADLGVMVGGISQSAVSQYANGTIALNVRAVDAFSSALGVAPEAISPGLAPAVYDQLRAGHRLSGTSSPGMVYQWYEIVNILSLNNQDFLADIFSVELPNGFFGGIVVAGDIAVLSRRAAPVAGDGAVIKHHNGAIEPCVYRPDRAGGFYAQTSDGALLHSKTDKIELLFSVIGMPTLRWSRLRRWA